MQMVEKATAWAKGRIGTREGAVALWVAGLLVVGLVAFAGFTRSADEAPAPPEAGATDAAGSVDADGAIGPAGAAGGADLAGPSGAASGGGSADVAGDRPAGGDAVADDPIAWVSARERSPVAAVPASLRVPKPEAVRGIYIGSWSAGSERRLESLIRLADATEVNTFVVDIKEALGEVSHRTQVPLARQVGADRNPAIADLGGLVARLRDHGIYPIARIVVFKDPLLAQARPEWAIVREDGSLWADQRGVHWVDPFNQDVWDYNIELAREAVALGFSEIQWDYVRFPDVPQSYLRAAVYPARDGRTMARGIRDFLIYSRERLDLPDVPQTADVFGITTSARNDVGIGQLWEKLTDVTDVLLPMVYPSHYPRGTWGHAVPNAAPYQVVKRAVDDAVARSAGIENAAAIRPWLQAFTLGQPPYGPREIRAQIQAVYDAGLTEWILWSPSSRYVREAFATPDGVAPWLGDLRAPVQLDEPAAPDDDGPLGVPTSRVERDG
jgi:hypothetical protein